MLGLNASPSLSFIQGVMHSFLKVINLLICDTDTTLETGQCTKHYPPGTNAQTGIHLKTKKINTKQQLL